MTVRGHYGMTAKTLALLDRIRELAECGLNRVEIAEAVGKSYDLIARLAHRHKIAVTRKPGSGRPRRA